MRGFKITKDHINGPESDHYEPEFDRTGMIHDIYLDGSPMPDGPEARFRMYDDDKELYYEGVLGDDPYSENEMEALNYGIWDAGCTIIEVMRNGTWKREIT